MGRYFFDVHDGDTVTCDPDGEDLPDLTAARKEAIAAAIDLICASLQSGDGPQLHRVIKILDERGSLFDIVQFRDAIKPHSALG